MPDFNRIAEGRMHGDGRIDRLGEWNGSRVLMFALEKESNPVIAVFASEGIGVEVCRVLMD